MTPSSSAIYQLSEIIIFKYIAIIILDIMEISMANHKLIDMHIKVLAKTLTVLLMLFSLVSMMGSSESGYSCSSKYAATKTYAFTSVFISGDGIDGSGYG